MTKVKSKSELQLLESEIKQLREDNCRLNDSLLLLKDQFRRERSEKQMYMNMCHKLEQQLKKANIPVEQPLNSSSLKSQNQIKCDDDIYDRARDRPAMAASMDPSMFKHQTQDKVNVKTSYKKKNSAQLQIEEVNEEAMNTSMPTLVTTTTEKKLKTLKDFKLENNLEEQGKEHELEKSVETKGQKPRRQTYFEKMRNK